VEREQEPFASGCQSAESVETAMSEASFVHSDMERATA